MVWDVVGGLTENLHAENVIMAKTIEIIKTNKRLSKKLQEV